MHAFTRAYIKHISECLQNNTESIGAVESRIHATIGTKKSEISVFPVLQRYADAVERSTHTKNKNSCLQKADKRGADGGGDFYCRPHQSVIISLYTCWCVCVCVCVCVSVCACMDYMRGCMRRLLLTHMLTRTIHTHTHTPLTTPIYGRAHSIHIRL